MKNIFFLLLISLTSIILTGCGVNNDVTVNTTNGACPNFESNTGEPYCLSVEVLNNSGGQNWITSTNYPINDLTVVINGASNILSPATSTSMDPNNCSGSTISPGGSCTFYLKISTESYAVNSQENVQVTLNYTINNTLFGGDDAGSNYSTTFSLYEFTNLYIAQNNGNLWMYNAGATNYGLVESADSINSIAVDTSAYGLLYMGGNNGIYQYGASNNYTSKSISAGINGSNNLLTSSGNLYATGLSGATGIWSFNLTNESWSSSAINTLTTQANTNTNTISVSGIIYLAVSNQVFGCPPSSTSSTSICAAEGNTLASTVTALGFLSGVNFPYTGLYAGTSTGLYIESTPSVWTPITLDNNSAAVTSITASNSAMLFVGDNVGNIWQFLAESPTTPTQFVNIPGNTASAINTMIVDNVSGTLYFTAGSTSSKFTLYSCPLIESSGMECQPSTIISDLIYTSSISGMGIGSSLLNTSTPGL